MAKFLICNPRGGFIDMIGDISRSLKLCEQRDRILVIDTRKSYHFRDNFHKYFFTHNKHVYTEDIDSLYLSLTKNELFHSNKCIVNNIDKDIVYFLKHFSLKPIILNTFKQRYNLLPMNYISVHIRNTDYKSDVDLFIKNNYSILNDRHIFLATDDFNTIVKFKEIFKHVYTFSNIVVNSKNPHNHRYNGGIHWIKRSAKDHELFNIDTLTDFLLLSCSTEYLFSCRHSGFSACANILFKEKKTIANIIKSL